MPPASTAATATTSPATTVATASASPPPAPNAPAPTQASTAHDHEASLEPSTESDDEAHHAAHEAEVARLVMHTAKHAVASSDVKPHEYYAIQEVLRRAAMADAVADAPAAAPESTTSPPKRRRRSSLQRSVGNLIGLPDEDAAAASAAAAAASGPPSPKRGARRSMQRRPSAPDIGQILRTRRRSNAEATDSSAAAAAATAAAAAAASSGPPSPTVASRGRNASSALVHNERRRRLSGGNISLSITTRNLEFPADAATPSTPGSLEALGTPASTRRRRRSSLDNIGSTDVELTSTSVRAPRLSSAAERRASKTQLPGGNRHHIDVLGAMSRSLGTTTAGGDDGGENGDAIFSDASWGQERFFAKMSHDANAAAGGGAAEKDAAASKAASELQKLARATQVHRGVVWICLLPFWILLIEIPQLAMQTSTWLWVSVAVASVINFALAASLLAHFIPHHYPCSDNCVQVHACVVLILMAWTMNAAELSSSFLGSLYSSQAFVLAYLSTFGDFLKKRYIVGGSVAILAAYAVFAAPLMLDAAGSAYQGYHAEHLREGGFGGGEVACFPTACTVERRLSRFVLLLLFWVWLLLPTLLLRRVKEHLHELIGRIEAQAELLVAVSPEEERMAEEILNNILPPQINKLLMERPGRTIAHEFSAVSLMFGYVGGLHSMVMEDAGVKRELTGLERLNILNQLVSLVDDVTEDFAVEKIKTIGEVYMVASGMPEPDVEHASNLASFAIAFVRTVQEFEVTLRSAGIIATLKYKVGLACGPAVAGIIGQRQFTYDVFGDTVNVASRCYSNAPYDTIMVTPSMHNLLVPSFVFIPHPKGKIPIKGKGMMATYLLQRARLPGDPVGKLVPVGGSNGGGKQSKSHMGHDPSVMDLDLDGGGNAGPPLPPSSGKQRRRQSWFADVAEAAKKSSYSSDGGVESASPAMSPKRRQSWLADVTHAALHRNSLPSPESPKQAGREAMLMRADSAPSIPADDLETMSPMPLRSNQRRLSLSGLPSPHSPPAAISSHSKLRRTSAAGVLPVSSNSVLRRTSFIAPDAIAIAQSESQNKVSAEVAADSNDLEFILSDDTLSGESHVVEHAFTTPWQRFAYGVLCLEVSHFCCGKAALTDEQSDEMIRIEVEYVHWQRKSTRTLLLRVWLLAFVALQLALTAFNSITFISVRYPSLVGGSNMTASTFEAQASAQHLGSWITSAIITPTIALYMAYLGFDWTSPETLTGVTSFWAVAAEHVEARFRDYFQRDWVYLVISLGAVLIVGVSIIAQAALVDTYLGFLLLGWMYFANSMQLVVSYAQALLISTILGVGMVVTIAVEYGISPTPANLSTLLFFPLQFLLPLTLISLAKSYHTE